MGPWGIGAFENDVASDWLEDLADSDPAAFFDVCLDLSAEQQVGYVAGVGVVCTAEIIRALQTGRRREYPPAARVWLSQHHELCVDRWMVPAIGALYRVLSSDSELNRRWEQDSERYDAWLIGCHELVRQLLNLQYGAKLVGDTVLEPGEESPDPSTA